MFDHKLEPILTMKIVDNFVRFGMPYLLCTALAFTETENDRIGELTFT